MKVTEMKNAISRLRNGLNKLEDANIEVAKMQIMLKEKQPKSKLKSDIKVYGIKLIDIE